MPPAPPETTSVRSVPRSTDLSEIEFTNAELSLCALCTACVRGERYEIGANNVASTFPVSCARVEVRTRVTSAQNNRDIRLEFISLK